MVSPGKAGPLRRIPELALPVVLEQDVSPSNGRHVEIGIAIVVDVGE